jgi:hypothetical protein
MVNGRENVIKALKKWREFKDRVDSEQAREECPRAFMTSDAGPSGHPVVMR